MSIYHHLTLGTNNMDKARAFYNSALAPLGINHLGDKDNMSVWGTDAPQFVLLTPSDGKPACVGNGLTIGFNAPDQAAVNEFHKNALAAGGTDEGAPGPRTFAPNAYAAYVRDLDGNKIMTVTYNS